MGLGFSGYVCFAFLINKSGALYHMRKTGKFLQRFLQSIKLKSKLNIEELSRWIEKGKCPQINSMFLKSTGLVAHKNTMPKKFNQLIYDIVQLFFKLVFCKCIEL